MSRAWSEWHPVVEGGVYAPIPSSASGVYIIASRRSGRALYVGESHSGRLRKTCLRHFQKWKQDWMHAQPRQTYDPSRVQVCWLVVAGGERAVKAAERDAMLAWQPRDNYSMPADLVEEEADVAPF